MLWAGWVRHRVLSHYIASLLASKSGSSHQVQIARSSSFAKADNGFRFSLGARSLLAQTMAFAHLLWTYPRGLWPCGWRRNPYPLQSMASLGAGISSTLAWSIPLSHAWRCILVPHIGKWSSTPSAKVPQNILTKILTYWKMVSYPLIKEGQLSHKYAIASYVEPMNLLSKGSNKSLPKYRSTIWKNGLVPPCSILLG